MTGVGWGLQKIILLVVYTIRLGGHRHLTRRNVNPEVLGSLPFAAYFENFFEENDLFVTGFEPSLNTISSTVPKTCQ